MITTALHYIVLTSVILGFLAMLGWPITLLLRLGDYSPAPIPVVGACVLPLLSWYWLRLTGLGLRPMIVGLVGILVVLDLTLLLRGRADLHPGRAIATALCAGLAVTALCAVNFESVLRLDYVTTAVSGNTDAIEWVREGQHVNDKGLEDAGYIVDLDLGSAAKTDGFGGFVLLAAATTVTGTETYQIGLAAMIAAIAMVLLATARLVERLSGLGRLHSLLCATACLSPMLFFYVAGNYFFAQVLAMAVLPCIMLTLIGMSEAESVGKLITLAALLGLLLFFLLSAYAHMTFLSLPLLAPIAILAGSKFGFSRRLRWVCVGAASGLLLALVIAPDLTQISVDRALAIGNSKGAGWRLPAFLPTELLGFGRELQPQLTIVRTVTSAFIVLLAAWSSWYLYRRSIRAAGYCITIIAAILSSYTLLYWREGGGTYSQWKWITYLQPIFAAAVLSLLVLQVRYWMNLRPPVIHNHAGLALRVTSEAVASFFFLAAIVAGTISGTRVLEPLRGAEPRFFVTRQLVELERTDSLESVTEVNVDVRTFWDSLWAAYFLRDKTIYLVQPALSDVKPEFKAKWTLDRVDRGPLPIGQPSIEINNLYRIVQLPRGPFSNTSDSLDAQLSVISDDTVNGNRTLRVRALNTGPTTWLPYPSGGNVQLGGLLLDDAGNVVARDVIRVPLSVTTPVAHGWSVDVIVALGERSDEDHVALQMVAENVAWFGGLLAVGGGSTGT